MQRLFSTFPNSAPGAGILLLRVSLAAQLICEAVQGDPGAGQIMSVGLRIAGTVLASLLVAGLWTPLVAGLLTILEILLAWYSGNWELHAARATIAIGLMALGPGAWSVDAHRYGRKLINL